MKKAAFLLMVLTIVGKVLGFAREVTLSYFYGASGISDAYLISLTIPSVIFTLIGIGLMTSYIPVYSSIVRERSVASADKFTCNFINVNLIICSVIVTFVLLFAGPIVKLFASGFTGATLEYAIIFTRIAITSIYFSALIYIFSAYLQIKNDFISPALMVIPLNLVTILAIFLSAKNDVIIISIGSAIAVVVQFIFLLPFIWKKGFKYSFSFDKLFYKDPDIKKIMYLSIPAIIGVSVNQINVLVDRTLASQIAVGGISTLTYANRLNLFIEGIFVMSIATVIFPTLSKMAADHNVEGIKNTLSKAMGMINLLVIPATIGAMIFAEPIVILLFGRGAFDVAAVNMTASALFFYSIGMIGCAHREVLSRAFYSLQDTKTPMINAVIAIILNIILAIILSSFLGVGGLALATSIAAIFCTILLFISLRKKIGRFGIRSLAISFTKILIASILMGLFAKLFYSLMLQKMGLNFSLIFSMGLGAFVYFVIVYLMKLEEIDEIILILKKKINLN